MQVVTNKSKTRSIKAGEDGSVAERNEVLYESSIS